MKRLTMAILVGAFMATAGIAAAQTVTPDAPLFSKTRLSFGVRAEYAFWDPAAGSTLALPFKKEFGLGVPVSYALTAKRFPDGHTGPPTLSLTGRAVYFVDSRVTMYAIGLNLGLYEGGK